ncbi:MAG: hypothetical protein D3924_16560 [Candidatus Electrothrix sp. AR4]|nr:hypothetical protein [Candidatus Electrothrix sp. AR4]
MRRKEISHKEKLKKIYGCFLERNLTIPLYSGYVRCIVPCMPFYPPQFYRIPERPKGDVIPLPQNFDLSLSIMHFEYDGAGETTSQYFIEMVLEWYKI